MVKTVLVTPAQVDAAKAVVRRRAETGRPVPDALRRIAEADAERSLEAVELGEAGAGPISG